MAISDGFRNGYCVLFLASTFAIAFAIQNFLQDKCCSYPDDVIDFIPFRVCVEQCLDMDGCKAISYKQVMSACKLHFQECDPNECKEYMFSWRDNLTKGGVQNEPPEKLGLCNSFVKKCQPLLSPRNGKLLGNRFSEVSKVKIVCNHCYLNNGSDQRACQSGQWTGEEAICVADCPDTWVYHGGSCYLFATDNLMTFNQSADFCRQQCGYPVHINDAEENTFIKSKLRELGSDGCWIGLTDERVEGMFKWYDTDTTLNFTDWIPGEPSNGGNGEDCVHTWRDANYMWNDAPCSWLIEALCEKSLSTPVIG